MDDLRFYCPPQWFTKSRLIGLFSPVESPLCWGSYVLADLAIPKDKTTSNHFGILGSSPPGSEEGSLHKNKESYIFEAQNEMLG